MEDSFKEKKIDFVVSNFSDLENRLIDCLSYIPYTDQNFNTISPKFIPIILDTCSLIESIFEDLVDEKKGNFLKYSLKIEDYLKLSETISIILTSPIQFLNPFKDWQNKTPEWWEIYNKLKHDRLNNYHLITYKSVILSLAALHQVISKNRIFTNHIIAKGWVQPSEEDIAELYCARMIDIGCLAAGVFSCESNLFVSPLRDNFVENEGNVYSINYECEFSNRVRTLINFSEIDFPPNFEIS